MSDFLTDLVAERTLVGWLIALPDSPQLVTQLLTVDDFADRSARAIFAELSTTQAVTTVQQILARHPDVSHHELQRWVFDGRYLSEKEISALAVRVAERSVARRIYTDGKQAMLDAQDATLDAAEMIRRVRERAADIEAPDAPMMDPPLPFTEFMAKFAHDDFDWLIPDLIERRDRIIFTASGGVGKSTLLRQIAVCAATGVHPFYPDRALPAPVRVLLLDLENSSKHVHRKLRSIGQAVGGYDDRLMIKAHPQIWDITTRAGHRELFRAAREASPDLIVAGPIYRFYETGNTHTDQGGRDKARRVADIFDQLRDRHDCALLIEAHPSKGSVTLSPFGSAVWEWWPEQGLGLQPDGEGPTQVNVINWRFDRDDRHWPKRLARGGSVGWRVVDDGRRFGFGPQSDAFG